MKVLPVVEKDRRRSERLWAQYLLGGRSRTTTYHSPIAAPSVGEDQAAIATHVKTVRAADEAAAAATETAALKRDRDYHDTCIPPSSSLPWWKPLCLCENTKVGRAAPAGTTSSPGSS